ncbi:MAG: hypothetical protein Q8M29_18445 [Bacteroidota bacterium]|nr:hypothetical protein [Bacteroidota bacterium]
METNNKISDAFIKGLKEITAEIEDLQVQKTLGKMEAEDKLKEAKEKAKKLIDKAHNEYYTEKSEFSNLRSKLEHLKVQFALGKAETKEIIEEQKKNIMHAIHDVENLIKNH